MRNRKSYTVSLRSRATRSQVWTLASTDALFIQAGACNPSGIALSIVEACRVVREEGGNVCTDPAIRLMAHQLAFICNVRALDDGHSDYSAATAACEAAGGTRVPA